MKDCLIDKGEDDMRDEIEKRIKKVKVDNRKKAELD